MFVRSKWGGREGRLGKIVAEASERSGYRRFRERRDVIRFSRHYYYSLNFMDTKWLGVPLMKPPFDVWMVQEIIAETRPDVIVETGTYRGGSALFMATVCEALGHGRVISIDINPLSDELPRHGRIEYVGGRSSVDPELELPDLTGRVMVVLDSAHWYDHVRMELERYAPLVSTGCYLIVEDTNLNGNPIQPGFGPGPMEAVREFLAAHPEFRSDRTRERNLMTFHPSGYLRREHGDRAAEAGA